MSNDDQIEGRINQALDTSVEDLTPEIRRSLNRIRIEATQNKNSKGYLWKYASALSVAFVFVIGSQLMSTSQSEQFNLFAEVPQEEFDLLDDLEFVYWMAEAEKSETL